MANGLHIRWLIRRDLPEVLDIDSHSFEEAWSEADFIHCIRQRNSIGMVIEDEDSDVIGYMLYWLNAKSFLLERLAIHHNYRRQGAGSFLLQKLCDKTSPQVRRKIVYNCDEADLCSQLFLKASGFTASAVIRDHFESGRSAYRFEYWHPGVKRQSMGDQAHSRS
jgi:ribosomal-protein-alanine N-acetyltransferase